MEHQTIHFRVPKGWQELTQRQLRELYQLLCSPFSQEEVETILFMRWSGTAVVTHESTNRCILRNRRVTFETTAEHFADLVRELQWVRSIPTYPVRLHTIERHKALPADFQGVPFETFLMAENLYQGFLHTRMDELLDELGSVLYGYTQRHTFRAEERISIFYWYASLKEHLATTFSDFLQTRSDAGATLMGGASLQQQLQRAMDTQIRALTKGDITKEQEILRMDTWRALAELNAQAREYQEIKRLSHAK